MAAAQFEKTINNSMALTRQKYTEVIGIASGKGGAGKTTVAVNLALSLQEKGFRVMLFDADLGLANAPILLGTRCPFNISHVMRGEKTLADMGVERIKTVGEPFDPELHEAVSLEEGDGNREVVTEELQAGYRISNDVIRHAMVRVVRQ